MHCPMFVMPGPEHEDEEKIHDVMQTMGDPIAGMLTCYNFDDPSFAPEGKEGKGAT